MHPGLIQRLPNPFFYFCRANSAAAGAARWKKWDAGCKHCQAIAVGIGTAREKQGVRWVPTEPLVHPHGQRDAKVMSVLAPTCCALRLPASKG